MRPEIAKLGHVDLVTPDLAESLWFFGDVVGLTVVDRGNGVAHLRGLRDREHHTLTLRSGGRAELRHVGWRTRRPEDVAAFAERVEAAGTAVTRIDAGEELGRGEAVRFRTPDGHRFELYHDVERATPAEGRASRLKSRVDSVAGAGVSLPRRVDHVNLQGGDVAGTADWLRDALGFRLTEYIADAEGSIRTAWMTTNSLAHTVAYGGEPGSGPRFHHLAYYVDSLGDLAAAADAVREHGLEVEGGPGKHGITQANFLYLRDPASGHRVELFHGGYQIFDPDWEPIEWAPGEAETGITWFGQTPTMETTPVG